MRTLKIHALHLTVTDDTVESIRTIDGDVEIRAEHPEAALFLAASRAERRIRDLEHALNAALPWIPDDEATATAAKDAGYRILAATTR